MTPELVFLQLLALLLFWMLLPLLPALLELARPKDAAPLQSVGSDSGKLTYFATSFTERAHRDGLLGVTVPPRMSDGTPVVGFSRVVPFLDPRRPIESVVVLLDSVPLPDSLEFSAEVLARLSMPPSRGNTFRAILGQRDVSLGENSVVLRWVHALGLLQVAAGCRLFGRATSSRSIILGTGVLFERLQAPVIRVTETEAYQPPARPTGSYERFQPRDGEEITEGMWHVNGDVRIPAESLFAGSIVARGDVVIGDGARVTGSIKSHGKILAKSRGLVAGSLTAREDITVEAGARVNGPIISETSVLLEAAVIGSSTSPSTVTAPQIEMLPGATVYGAVMAGKRGVTSLS